MRKPWISGLTDKMIRRDIVSEADRDVMEYGLDMLVYTIISALLILLAVPLGTCCLTTLLIIFQFPLQSFGGGYHAMTHFRCMLLMVLIWGLCMIINAFFSDTVILLLSSTGCIAIWGFAPIEHINAPMSALKKKKMRMLARITASLLLLFALLTMNSFPIPARAALLALCSCGFSEVMGLFSMMSHPS